MDAGHLSQPVETSVTLPFADGDYGFFLSMQRLVAAEREIEGSIFQLFDDLGQNLGAVADATLLVGPSPARLKHCQSVIRNALIGAGEPEQQARELVDTYCYPARPAIYDLKLAFDILSATIYGVSVKKKDAPVADEPSPSEREQSSSTAPASASTGEPQV